MKKTLLKLVVLAGAIGALTLVGGCSTKKQKATAIGAGVGALAGAGVGGLIGKNVGGALLGAGIGGIGGALIGNASVDDEDDSCCTAKKECSKCSCDCKKS
ncbi:MAG: glycine zipper domain-containing protein [bacterium]